jgi:hypothetical protein
MARLSSAGVVFALVALWACAARSEETYPTNLELVEAATRAALDSVRISAPPIAESDIEILIEGGHAGGWLVQKIVNDRMIQRGWDVRVVAADADSLARISTPYVLNIKIVQLDLVYGRQWRRYVIGSKVVERVARASFYLELVDRVENEILETKNTRGEMRDAVPASALKVLSDSKYAFAAPELQEGSTDKYLEGTLVLAIIGVLVYLFYSNKTAS